MHTRFQYIQEQIYVSTPLPTKLEGIEMVTINKFVKKTMLRCDKKYETRCDCEKSSTCSI